MHLSVLQYHRRISSGKPVRGGLERCDAGGHREPCSEIKQGARLCTAGESRPPGTDLVLGARASQYPRYLAGGDKQEEQEVLWRRNGGI